MNDLEALQGTWKQVGYERDGDKQPTDELNWNPHVKFVENSFTVTLSDGSIPIRGNFNLDPTQTPKTMEFTDTHGADAGRTFLAIYSLDADRFMFCASEPGLDRPTEFSTKLGQVLRINVRQK